jgi:dolichyl-diphosphooligosaccharide--protein glycosyltransferase
MADDPEEPPEQPDPPEPPRPAPLEQARRAFSSNTGLVVEGLVVVTAFTWMLWVRLRSLDNLVRDGTLLFSGTDPYYHFRNLLVVVHNFPRNTLFDPWTFFPHGRPSPGQFGTLFEQVLAGAILLAHGGSVPAMDTLRYWAAVYPAVLGSLTVVPVYLVVRRATNRIGAVYAAVAISFVSGQFLTRSLAGTFDHHVAEVLLSTFAAAGLLWAIDAAQRHAPDLEDAWTPLPADLDDLRTRLGDLPGRPVRATLGASTVAGLLLGLYLLAWNYGVLFVVVLDLFALLAYLASVRVDRRTDTLTIPLVVTHLVAGLVLLSAADVAAFDLHRHSLLQPALLLLSAVGVLVLQGIRTGLDRWIDEDAAGGVSLTLAEAPPGLVYAGAALAATLAGFLLTALLLPDLFGTLAAGYEWVVGAGEGSRVKTIAEARTLGWSGLVNQVSWMAYPAAVAVAVAGWRAWTEAEPAPSLFLAWGGLILVATINQVRFSYYAGLVTAVLNGYLMGELCKMTGLANRVREHIPEAPDPDDQLAHRASTAGQITAVLAVAFFLFPGLLVATDDQPRRSWEVATALGPGEAAEWQPGLEWLRDNTPSDPAFDLTRTYDDHPGYGDDSYGVLSWWDYGHWIQLTGERAPVANPFQQGAPFASTYFTSQPEESNELLRDWEGDERVRYVMIDDAMATGKFGAITVWAERQELNSPSAQRNYTIQDQEVQLPVLGGPFENTTLARLFFGDADGLGHYRLVHELTGRGDFRLVGNVLQVGQQQARIICLHQAFPTRRCPVQPATGDILQKIQNDEPIPVAQNGQQVGYAWDVSYVSSLKIFERVEGAVLTGEAPAGSTVTASVAMDSAGFRSFPYTRSTTLEEGSGNATFELRVSYASGDPSGEAGRTVDAVGPYNVTVQNPDGNVTQRYEVPVPDEAVLQGSTIPIAGTG